MAIVEQYLRDLKEAHASGVAETSAYPALANLLNAVGDELKPKVRCVIHPKSSGAGIADGGLFAANQFPRGYDGDALQDFIPERGVIEAKGASQDVAEIAGRVQVGKYLEKYGQVLVTTYREFLLLILDDHGAPRALERFALAESAEALWSASPRTLAAERGPALVEYLKRVMLQATPLTSPQDVAEMLAAYAREARLRVDQATLPALGALRAALEQALGIAFTDERGEHFFRATLVQTLFYGVFSAWVLWCRSPEGRQPESRFAWRQAAWSLHVPMIRALYHQIASPAQLGPLQLAEVLDWTADALNRVNRETFFQRFQEDHAVQYFYEPFLEAYDPGLRKDLGVWYTPPAIVEYMVARVDTVLREELGLPDGLADPNVYVLDPCCGTGAYLVEVLRRIAKTKREQGEDAWAGHEAKQAAMHRVFGFEILPAPFVVAHMQLGMLLQDLGAGLDEAHEERVGVYLTNALTGWEPAEGPKQQFLFPELETERDAAAAVKQSKPILVILGNPPYNSFAGLAIGEERDLTNAYRTTKRAPAPQGHGLNDLYVRFFRMAERKIVEGTGQGVVCFISNYSWLDGLSHTGMRERYLEVFDRIWIDNLNGDKFRTGKRTPDGLPDPSVFSTPTSREGIGIGTAIALLVRTASHTTPETLNWREWWGTSKRQELRDSTSTPNQPAYRLLQPKHELGAVFVPMDVAVQYVSWPRLPEVILDRSPGVNTSRDLDLVSIDEAVLDRKIEAFLDPEADFEVLSALVPSLMRPSAVYRAGLVRASLIAQGIDSGRKQSYSYRPFDTRHLYWHGDSGLLDRPRPELVAALRDGNRFLISRQKAERGTEGSPLFVAKHLPDRHLTRPGSDCLPMFRASAQRTLFEDGEDTANLSPAARRYLADLGIPDPDADEETAGLVWMHALAIGYSPAYLAENADGIRQDWPRIPLPADADMLRASAALGRLLADLLDPEIPVPGVTTGSILDALRPVAELVKAGGQPPDLDHDLAVTAGWGHAGRAGVTMPGRGRTTAGPPLAEFGPTVDVYLNDTVFWRAVPQRVWDYTIGGYQVIKKWLSYRERPLLGRDLKPDEAREVTHIARRLAAIVLLEPELDANYQAVRADVYPWPVTG